MRIHIVQKGDTLFEIAKQYGVDFEKLVELNSQLSSPDMIMPGMKIKIPSESKQVRSSTKKDVRISRDKDERKLEKEKRVEPIERRTLEKEKRDEVKPKPIERPSTKDEDEKIRKTKKIELKVPEQTYPKRPIIEKPKMPKKVKLDDIRDDVKEMKYDYDDIMPEREEIYKRRLREPLPVHQAMNQAMQYYYPPQQPMRNRCHCCHCCSCRRRPSPSTCHCSTAHYPSSAYYPYQQPSYSGNIPYYHPNYHLY